MWSIRLKALLMLVVFAANFTVFCHCATTQKHHCCCEQKAKPCHSAEAVKFHLAEKQLADQVQAAPLPVIALFIQQPNLLPVQLSTSAAPDNCQYPPPDILSLQQRLLI